MKTYTKFSHGVCNLLRPITNYIPRKFYNLMSEAAYKKSRKVVYPCDLLTVNIILETVHEVTGERLEVQVEGKDIPAAFNRLAALVADRDFQLELAHENFIYG